MTISIITLFPEMFEKIFEVSMVKRAQDKGKVIISMVNLRTFGIGKHHTVDDKPYGGGVGMVLRVDVLEKAISSVKKGVPGEKVILMDPKGTQYTQTLAEDLSKLFHIILVCGHYEGFDERVRLLVDSEISIGDYVLSGGELPAMVITESVTRLIPGVLAKGEAHALESFSEIDGKRLLEHPHYTRPRIYKGIRVPTTHLSGNQEKIQTMRGKQAMKLTKKRRPDMLKKKVS